MRYLFINSVFGVRSTGRLIAEKCRELQADGHECCVAYGRETTRETSVSTIQIGKKRDYMLHALLSRILDCQGFASRIATKSFLRRVDMYKPDVVWLHNLHGYYINVELLFSWLKQHSTVRVYWTLHDCWAFTGHCSHFTVANCDKWKTGCGDCSQKREYPTSLFLDRSKGNYHRKKVAFTGLKNMTIITPSKWLAGLVKQSFLGEYPVEVQPNQIDESIFKPTPSSFRQDYNLEGKIILLGVAVGWEATKGFPDMLMLREVLDERYVIVLVGTTQKQIAGLPQGILGIERTANQKEMAAIYSAADVFVNPTHQDNYPTVNLEARACGLPVVTYDVGGSPESAGERYIVPENDINAMVSVIHQLTLGAVEVNGD